MNTFFNRPAARTGSPAQATLTLTVAAPMAKLLLLQGFIEKNFSEEQIQELHLTRTKAIPLGDATPLRRPTMDRHS